VTGGAEGEPDPGAAARAAMDQASAAFRPLVDAANQMREDLERRGFTPDAASAMAAEYFSLVIRKSFKL
jgi:hypothetical protein